MRRDAAAFADVLQPLEDTLYPFGDPTMGFDHENHDICISRAPPGGRDHRAVQSAARAEKTRRVDKHDLAVAFHCHAANTGTGCLHLVCHDRHLGSDHTIEKGGFARVGLSDQGNKACACRHLSCSSRAKRDFAAACSACRLDPAVARPSVPSCNCTEMVNSGW